MAHNKDKSLTSSEIASELRQRTGKKWNAQLVNKELAKMEYQIKQFHYWQPTDKGMPFADFSTRVPKWSPEVIDLIEKNLPNQLKLPL